MSTTTATLNAHLEAIEKQIADLQTKAEAIRQCLAVIEGDEAPPVAQKAKEAKKEPTKTKRRYLTTADFEMWSMFANELLGDGKAHPIQAVIKAAKGAGRVTDTTVSHWLGREVKAGKVQRVGLGLYQRVPMQLTRVAGGAS